MALILGIGNSLLQDDGIGCHLVELLLQKKPHWPVDVVDGGTLSFNLVSLIESTSHLIVIDAANLNQSPGTVKTLLNDKLDLFLSKPGKSVHEVSLSELFDISRLTESLPIQRAMVAIQPKKTSWGEHLTTEVFKAQSIALEHIEAILRQWEFIDNET